MTIISAHGFMDKVSGIRFTTRAAAARMVPKADMIWKRVPDFADYEVSEYGDLRKGFLPLTPERVQGSGRKRFTLSKGGRKYRFHAAKLVALAFIGPPPFDGAEVCHNDSFMHNNHYSNLRWGSRAANAADESAFRAKLRSHSSLPRKLSEQLAAEAAEFLAKSN